MDTLQQETREPGIEPVVISGEKCPEHNFFFVSYPRDSWTQDDLGMSAKCPLRACHHGILKPRNDE